MSIIRKDLGPRPPARLKSKLSVVMPGKSVPDVRLELKSGGEFSLYSSAPDELEKAMDRLTFQTIEPNPFQSAAFLLPTMRRNGQQMRLAVIEDSTNAISDDNLSALMAFSVEGKGSHLVAHSLTGRHEGYSAPLISRSRPMATLDQLFEALAGTLVNLPGVAVFPELVADGLFMRFARAVAAARGLPFRVTGAARRRSLSKQIDPTARLSISERADWQENLSKWKSLQSKGKLSYRVARNPEETTTLLGEMLLLSNDDEHKRKVSDVTATCNMLARRDWLRIHALYLDDQLIAAAVQPTFSGQAWVWQLFQRPDIAHMATDEQLIVRLTEWNLRDANINNTRSSLANGPYLAERFWPVDEGYATLMIAIRPGMERTLDVVANDYHQKSIRA